MLFDEHHERVLVAGSQERYECEVLGGREDLGSAHGARA